MTWGTSRDGVLDEAAALHELVDNLAPDQWSAATTCEGWTVAQCASHVAQVMAVQQLAFQHMLAGSTETPAWEEQPLVDPESVRAAVAASHATAIETMGRLQDEHADKPVPLPFGTFPAPIALDILLLEYGTHRWDIAHAVDPGAALSPAASACVLGLLPAFLTFFAAAPPEEPIAYRLVAPSATLEVAPVDGAWALAPPPEGAAVTTITGDDSSVALFALGRIGPDHPGVEVDGDHAKTFKTWVPGP